MAGVGAFHGRHSRALCHRSEVTTCALCAFRLKRRTQVGSEAGHGCRNCADVGCYHGSFTSICLCRRSMCTWPVNSEQLVLTASLLLIQHLRLRSSKTWAVVPSPVKRLTWAQLLLIRDIRNGRLLDVRARRSLVYFLCVVGCSHIAVGFVRLERRVREDPVPGCVCVCVCARLETLRGVLQKLWLQLHGRPQGQRLYEGGLGQTEAPQPQMSPGF